MANETNMEIELFVARVVPVVGEIVSRSIDHWTTEVQDCIVLGNILANKKDSLTNGIASAVE